MEQRLKDYARLIVKIGINVQKGEEVWINAQLDQPEFVRYVVEELYKEGTKKVVVRWSDDPTTKIHYKKQTCSTLSKVPQYEVARYKYMAKHLPSMLHLISEDPDVFKGVNQMKVSKARAKSYPKIKPYRDAMDGKYKWCIAAIPNTNWAKKVFPGCSDADAVNKLWDAILSTSRVDGNDPVENWNEHNRDLIEKKTKLNNYHFKKLIYKSANGTDFSVELNDIGLWEAGLANAKTRGDYNPNIPSEEVFTSPLAGKCEGKLVASKPLSYNGELIEDFSIDFKDGKVCDVHARKGESLLKEMVGMDEGAKMLGEVALIPYDSPIRKTGILFYNTLFDENAACHFALGCGFPECIKGGLEMNHADVIKNGVNDSMIHVDFMVGTSDLDIVGIDDKGNKIQVFKNGNWAI